ncbi:PREDICTED: olfactory receptor 2A5-like [Nanorana parkeri]|uniref:olfactory receptor 2A5-like n=1 Tax=Nanorana parkeri TaxID=125878 RepID=UPI0008549AF0|nr:PREDICTED: olfactory receptor 2A5-like [Nanorana parkeri]
MDSRNWTIATELILLGFSTNRNVNLALFPLFFVMYVITFVGNGLMIFIIFFNPRLHIPMYFFLCILSVLDLSYSSTVVPKLLEDLLSVRGLISIRGCAMQLYMILLLGGTECLLLALMAYDRYVAICRPLHYTVLMRWSVCYILTAFMCTASFVIYLLPSLLMPLELCYPNQINHFVCEVLAVIKLACGNIYLSELVIFSTSFISLLLPFVFIIVSYVCIICSVLKVHSAGRSKAFSTCTSHISVVSLFFGTSMIMYFGPSSQYSSNQQKYVSLFYVVVSPMLNPLIYSLNNREVKRTFVKVFSSLDVSR